MLLLAHLDWRRVTKHHSGLGAPFRALFVDALSLSNARDLRRFLLALATNLMRSQRLYGRMRLLTFVGGACTGKLRPVYD